MRPGLFGKMPAHGDFVRRGWDDATVDALDAWCTGAVARLGDAERGDGCAGRIVRCWLPAGMLGPAALHLALARSRDRAGRGFVLALGVAGAGAWDHAGAAGAATGAVLRAALAGECDADGAFAALAATLGDTRGAGPAEARWWRGDAAIEVAGGPPDAAALARRLSAAVAA